MKQRSGRSARAWVCGVCALGCAWPQGAQAQPLLPEPVRSSTALGEPAANVAPPPSAAADGLPRPLAGLLAFVPGILLQGSGHFALGERDTAYELFAMQGIGLGVMALGAIPIATSGASRYVSGPGAVLAIGGLSLATTALFGDWFGTLVPPEYRGLPELSLPNVETELGFRYAYHPAVRYGSLVYNRVALRWEGLTLEPSGFFAVERGDERLRLGLSYRYFGPRAYPALPSPSGSSLELGAAVSRNRLSAERFTITTGELVARARLDLADLPLPIPGAFSVLELGFGLERYDYDVLSSSAHVLPAGGDPGVGDYDWLVLGRFGFGFYLGGERAPVGELLLYYDHRHDDFAGGLHQVFVGIAGHGGVDATLYLSDELGIRAELEAGGGIMGGASLLVRQGLGAKP